MDPNKQAEKSYDMINPQHYKSSDGKECIDVMIDLFGVDKVKAFCQLNAFKYKFRAGKKPGASKEQDLAKAQWYKNKLKELASKYPIL